MIYDSYNDLLSDKKIFYVERKGKYMAIFLNNGDKYFAEKDKYGKIHVYNGINDELWDKLDG